MTVVLEPPLTRSGVWSPDGFAQPEPLLFGPRFVRGPRAGRWHRPRTEWCTMLAWNVGQCLVCGSVTPLRSSGGAYSPRWGMTNHPPGPELVAGCPFHAWRGLHLIDGAVRCGCKTGAAT